MKLAIESAILFIGILCALGTVGCESEKAQDISRPDQIYSAFCSCMRAGNRDAALVLGEVYMADYGSGNAYFWVAIGLSTLHLHEGNLAKAEDYALQVVQRLPAEHPLNSRARSILDKIGNKVEPTKGK